MRHFFYSTRQQRSRDLRKSLTVQEARVWLRVKQRGLHGFKFRRQHPIGPYFVDFYCPKLKLAVELDGGHHYEPAQRAYDLVRQRFIESTGIMVVRYPNNEINSDIDAVLEDLARKLKRRAKELGRLTDTPPRLR